MEELAAVKASQTGDKTAFGMLIDQYYKSIYRYAFQYTGNHQDADDICQETFLRAFDSINQLKDGNRFKGWIFTIASNISRGKIKDKIHKSDFLNCSRILYENNDADEPLQKLSGKERAAVIHNQLQEMPERLRIITTLVIIEDFKQKDVSKILNCSEPSVSRDLENARNWLRIRLRHLI